MAKVTILQLKSVPTVEWIPPVPIMSESQNKNIPFLSPYGTVGET
jgi:hypothetical protein